jgi:hypothetical protein
MYKLTPQHENTPVTIHRLLDNTFIPPNPDNTDYQAYLRWLEAGNTPTPAEENQ